MVSRITRALGFRRDQRGNAGITFAIVLIPTAIMAGGAVDYGNVVKQKARLQAATDAASTAATSPVSASDGERMSIALKVYNANVSGTALANTPPVITVSANQVTVEAARDVPTPFLGLASIPTMPAKAYSRSAGTDVVSQSANAKVCLLALDPDSNDGLHLQGDNHVNFLDCWAHTNSTKPTAINANGNNAKAYGPGFCAVGGWTQTHDTYQPAPTAGCISSPDPYATAGAYGSGTYTPTFTPPTKSVTCKGNDLRLKKGEFTLDPGRYCGGINIQAGATVALNPGVYYIDNGVFNVQSGSSVTGSNVLLYLEGADASMTVIGGGTVTLSGRQTGSSYPGFLAIAHPNATNESNIQGGGTFKLEGVIYLPKQRIEVSGNGDVNNATISVFGMVARDFYFRGNGVFNMKKHGGTGNIPDIMPGLPIAAMRKTVTTD